MKNASQYVYSHVMFLVVVNCLTVMKMKMVLPTTSVKPLSALRITMVSLVANSFPSDLLIKIFQYHLELHLWRKSSLLMRVWVQ